MPTENRSSNTEMVSVPRGLIEELEQFGEGSTPVRAVRRDVLEQVYALLVQPAPQHQDEPVAWRYHVRTGGQWYLTTTEPHARMFVGTDDGGHYEPLYTHADPGEVERLKAELVESDHAFVRIASEAEQLRAQLAERDALLRDIRNSHGVMLMTHPPQDPWLNNRIDERIRAALSVGGAPSQQESTEDNPNGQAEP